MLYPLSYEGWAANPSERSRRESQSDRTVGCAAMATTVLVVEDDPVIIDLLTLTLELSGYDLPAGPVTRTDTTRIVRV